MSKHSNPTEQAMSEQELFSKVMDMLPLKADLNRLSAYSAYIDGARRAVALLTGHFPDIFTKGRDAPVNRAVIALIMSSKRHRFRSTNFCNVVKQMMHWREVFNDDCDFLTQKIKENYE